jgi:hypothetical protein
MLNNAFVRRYMSNEGKAFKSWDEGDKDYSSGTVRMVLSASDIVVIMDLRTHGVPMLGLIPVSLTSFNCECVTNRVTGYHTFQPVP